MSSFFCLENALAVTRVDEETPLIRKEFEYKKVNERSLKIYVTTPPKWSPKQKHPAIVFFHGGGWVSGKPGQFDQHSRYLASRGMVCFQVQYRLLNKKRPTESPEICIRDAKSAMRWVRRNRLKFGVDENRIASAGGSAGGHLAAAVGMIEGVNEPGEDLSVSTKSNAMILFNPVFDNGPGGWGVKRVGKDYPKFSPMHNISRDDPPAIVFLGSKDKLIPASTLKKFSEEMNNLKVRCEYKIYDGAAHGFFNFGRDGNRPFIDTVERSDRFLVSLGWLSGDSSLKEFLRNSKKIP